MSASTYIFIDKTACLILPVDMLSVDWGVRFVGGSVPDHHQRPLGAWLPTELLAHLAENQLITLLKVSSSRRAYFIHKAAQLGYVRGEVHVLGHVAVHVQVAVVAVGEDGDAQAGDVGEETLNDVSELTSDLVQAFTHGAGRVKGEDDLYGSSWRQGHGRGRHAGGSHTDSGDIWNREIRVYLVLLPLHISNV